MIKKILLFALVFALSFKVVIDTDYAWHLRAGQYILKTKSIPKHDIFSFSAPDYPYVYYSWGSEVAVAASYNALGNFGVSLLFALISTLTIYLIYQTAKIISQKEPYLALFVFFAPVAYAVGGGRIRSFGFLLFAATYLLFCKFTYQKSKIIWLMPLVFAVWANLHGSFLLGITTFLLLSILTAATQKDTEKTKTLILVNILSVAATLANPYFFRVWQQVLLISANYYSNLQYLNLDWQPLIAKEGGGWIFAALATALVILLFLVKNKIDTSQKLLLLVFISLSILTARFVIALFVFFLIPANQLILELDSRLKKGALESKFLSLISFLILLVLLLMSTLNLLEVKYAYSSLKNYTHLLNTKYPEKYSYMNWPYEAGTFIQNNLKNRRILNEANWAGLLLLQDENIKVFYYGAMDNFIKNGRPFVLEYLDLINANNQWQQKLNNYQIDAVFLPPSFPLIAALKQDPHWQVAYEDKSAVIMTKK